MDGTKFNIKKLNDIGLDVENIIYSLKFFIMLEMLTDHDKTYRKYKAELHNTLMEHYREKEACDIIIMKLIQGAGNQISETFLDSTIKRRKIDIN